MPIRGIKLTGLIVCVLTLSACASLEQLSLFKKSPKSNSPQLTELRSPAELHAQHMALITPIHQFTLKGRMGIQSNGKGYSVGTQWAHQEQQNTIKILSPIGSEMANIEASADGVKLTTNEGKVYNAKDAETLTLETLGWSLPMQGLEDWVLGRPSHKLPEMIEWDTQGKIVKMLQNGWKIEYPEYMKVGNFNLPKKIWLSHPKLTLKMVVEQWDNTNVMPDQTPSTP
jgi:outer membrane lipoprotein LolB